MTKLFGTDGMRGVALEPPLDRDTVTRLGAALAAHLDEEGRPLRILLAGDTRASTPVLARWLAGGFLQHGGTVSWAGVLPTPAVSRLLRTHADFGAGVVVSASHNPAQDNGIKLVWENGNKWPSREEARLEKRMAFMAANGADEPLPPVDAGLTDEYLSGLEATLPGTPLAQTSLVVDAANGAAALVAGEFFQRLGASVTVINGDPDGTNINAGCGALHPEGLARAVVERGASCGVAFDGDADRAILVADDGSILDGDDTLLIWGDDLDRQGRLPSRSVVATVMSNLGLELGLRQRGIATVRCPVGDREVWEAMRKEGLALGGEQSGHVICAHHSVTGDGLLTAAHVFAIAQDRGVRTSHLPRVERIPQVLVNVRVASRRPLGEVTQLSEAIARSQAELDGRGRVLVRFSGTEPLLRIMVEAPRGETADAIAAELESVALRALGAPGENVAV